jgi:hypothetical protein
MERRGGDVLLGLGRRRMRLLEAEAEVSRPQTRVQDLAVVESGE